MVTTGGGRIRSTGTYLLVVAGTEQRCMTSAVCLRPIPYVQLNQLERRVRSCVKRECNYSVGHTSVSDTRLSVVIKYV